MKGVRIEDFMNQLQETVVTLPRGVSIVSEEVKNAKAEGAEAKVENSKAISDLPKLPTLAQIERQYINQVLAAVGGSKEKAAQVLGVSVKTVYNKLNSYAKNEA
jgi:Nif-specific regulatory protein